MWRLLGLGNRQVGYFPHNPVKIRLTHRVQIRIRSGIHEVDCVGNPVFHCELHGVQVVPQRLAELQRILLHALQQLPVIIRRILQIPLVVRQAWVVGHDVHLLLPHHVAAEVLVELDSLLVGHAQVARFIVGPEELLAIVNVVDIAPAAAVHRLQESVLAHVSKHSLPIQRIFEVAHGAVRRSLGMLLVRQDHGFGHGHAQLLRERVVEELVVGRPPEGIVDDDGSIERGMFQIGAIERDVVRDAVHDHRVGRGFIQVHGAGLHEFGPYAVQIARVDVLHQRAGKAVFHAEKDTDRLHCRVASIGQSRPHHFRGAGCPAQVVLRNQCTAEAFYQARSIHLLEIPAANHADLRCVHREFIEA